jgi:hypothetical protein
MVLANIFFITFPVLKGNVEHPFTFPIYCKECMFHLEHVDLKCQPYNLHGQEMTQRDAHPRLTIQEDFVLVQNLQSVLFIFTLYDLYGPLAASPPQWKHKLK